MIFDCKNTKTIYFWPYLNLRNHYHFSGFGHFSGFALQFRNLNEQLILLVLGTSFS